jgi:hypothetical protein
MGYISHEGKWHFKAQFLIKVFEKFGNNAKIGFLNGKLAVNYNDRVYILDEDVNILNKMGTVLEMTLNYVTNQTVSKYNSAIEQRHPETDLFKELEPILKLRANFPAEIVRGNSRIMYYPHTLDKNIVQVLIIQKNKTIYHKSVDLSVGDEVVSMVGSKIAIKISEDMILIDPNEKYTHRRILFSEPMTHVFVIRS